MVVATNQTSLTALHNIVESLKTLVKNLIGRLELQEVQIQKIFPVGSVMLFSGSKPPKGWLLCDGSVVVRNDYGELFQVIGETYGKGDDHNTFNLPDLRGRVAIGAGEAAGVTNRKLGEQIGSETYNLTVAQMPNHAHTGSTHGAGNHSHTGSTHGAGNHAHSGTTNSANPRWYRTVGDTGNSSYHNHEVGWRSSGWTADHNDANFAGANHTHNFSTNAVGDHTHNFSTHAAGEHQHTIAAEGEGQPYSVMQPSLSLNYIIKY